MQSITIVNCSEELVLPQKALSIYTVIHDGQRGGLRRNDFVLNNVLFLRWMDAF